MHRLYPNLNSYTEEYKGCKAEKISSPIDIDRNINKEPWQNANQSKRFVHMVSGAAGMYNTQAALLWNDEYLYVAFIAEEPFVKAKLVETDSLIFQKNDLELFIDGGDCYFEPELNAVNTIYKLFFIWRHAFTNGHYFDNTLFNVHHPKAYTFGGRL